MSSGDVENGKQISIEEFVQAGRTGRRNALPDILSVSVSTCGTDNITKALQKLHTTTGKYWTDCPISRHAAVPRHTTAVSCVIVLSARFLYSQAVQGTVLNRRRRMFKQATERS